MCRYLRIARDSVAVFKFFLSETQASSRLSIKSAIHESMRRTLLRAQAIRLSVPWHNWVLCLYLQRRLKKVVNLYIRALMMQHYQYMDYRWYRQVFETIDSVKVSVGTIITDNTIHSITIFHCKTRQRNKIYKQFCNRFLLVV